VREILKVPDGNQHPMDDEEKRKEFFKFYTDCTESCANMELCDVVLDFLPKGRIPQKGILINNITGQPFTYDFKGNERTL